MEKPAKLFLPIYLGSIRIPQTRGSQGISGRISSTLTRHLRGERLTDRLKKNGQGKSCGMGYQDYQKNSVPWLCFEYLTRYLIRKFQK